MECTYSINEPHETPNFLAFVLQLDLPLVSVFQLGGGRVWFANSRFAQRRSHMKVKILGNTPSLTMWLPGWAVEYSRFPGVWGCDANAAGLFLLLAMFPCVVTDPK